jgi:hypothetical protein
VLVALAQRGRLRLQTRRAQTGTVEPYDPIPPFQSAPYHVEPAGQRAAVVGAAVVWEHGDGGAAAADDERAAVNEHHNRQLAGWRGSRGSPDILQEQPSVSIMLNRQLPAIRYQEEAIFGGLGNHSWLELLRALWPISQRLPSGPCRVPRDRHLEAQKVSWRLRIWDTLQLVH